MGQQNCSSSDKRIQTSENIVERKNPVVKFQKIAPKQIEDDCTEIQFQNSEEAFPNIKSKSHLCKTNIQKSKLVSTKGLSIKQINSLLTDDQNPFEEDLKESSQQQQIQMKKVKVKWHSFIKMKKKKFTDDYYVLKEIGRGGFGSVYKVRMRNGNIYRAAKKIQKKKLNEEQHEDLLGEMSIMMKLDHPNIVKLFQVYNQKKYYVMVMEFCDGGELFQRILNSSLSEEQIKCYTKQIFRAVAYMHSRGIVHRDLKPENMLIERQTNLVKIIDFGISVKISSNEILTSRVGTPHYIAPEVLCKRYNEKADLWSAGIVVYMMVVGKAPFRGKNSAQIMQKVLSDKINFNGRSWHKFDFKCIQFVQGLLDRNQRKRTSAKQALRHPWLESEQKRNLPRSEQILKRMQNFKFRNKLEAVVYTYIVSQLLTSSQKMNLNEYFHNFDKNQDGVIDHTQLRECMLQNRTSKTSLTSKKIQHILDYIDTNCSGDIDYTEFLVSAIDLSEKVTDEHLKQAFAYFDIDGNGKITLSEISQFLEDQTNITIENIFKIADENKDGLISQSEFIKALIKKNI